MFLVPMTLVGESWVPNGAMLVSMPGAEAGDVVLGVSAMLVYCAYVAHLVVTVWNPPVALVRLASLAKREERWRAWGLFWLRSPVGLVPCAEPTAEMITVGRDEYAEMRGVLQMQRMLLGDEGAGTRKAATSYLRYAPYLDELNVLWFKVAELVLGSVINFASGIVTDSCFLQGFTVLLCVAIVLLLLVLKRPLAVPGQQLMTAVVYGSMLVAAVVVVVNLFVRHSTLEDAATVLFLISTAFVVLQSATDLLISVVAVREIVVRLIPRHLRRTGARGLGGNRLFCVDDSQIELIASDTSSAISGLDVEDVLRDREEEGDDDERSIQQQILAQLEREDREREGAPRVAHR